MSCKNYEICFLVNKVREDYKKIVFKVIIIFFFLIYFESFPLQDSMIRYDISENVKYMCIIMYVIIAQNKFYF